MTASSSTTTTVREQSPPKRYSLQNAAGLSLLPASEPIGCNSLISCLTHLSLSSLPPSPTTPRTPGTPGRGPRVTRFPPAPDPRPTSALGTREEQRRIYLGPKLSDRATGGPDAGPLIERFSCLFKDRECLVSTVPANLTEYNCKTNPRGIVSL